MRVAVKIFVGLTALFFAMFSGCSSRENPDIGRLRIKDDLGHQLVFAESPKRIVSLAPNLTEMIFALDCGNKLLANTTYCNYPKAAKAKPKAGSLVSVDYEKMIVLHPDLVLMTVEGNSYGVYEKLINLRFKVFVTNPRDFAGIERSFLKIGKICGKQDLAEKKISEWEDSLYKIKRMSANLPKRRVAFVISWNPLMLAGEKTFLNEFLTALALENVASASKLRYPIFSREEILRANPQIIIYPRGSIGSPDDVLKLFPEWKGIEAVKENKIVAVNPDLFFRPGPRFVKALNVLYEKLNTR